jgi:hypothetical protein
MLRAMARVFLPASFLILLGVAGCDCGSDPGVTPDSGPSGECGGAMCADAVLPATAGSRCCEPMMMCAAYDLTDEGLCMPGYMCPSPDDLEMDPATCAFTCTNCMVRPALEPGQLATYLDMVVQTDGTTVLSGYGPGVPPTRRYGDLVFGTWDAAASSVEWEIIDGAPSMPVTNDPDGWRGGVSAAGDDVGRFTSMVETSTGELLIAYYDQTNGALKLARRTGGSWDNIVVDDTGDSGRYASLVLDSAGRPVIAYLKIEPSTITPGRQTASLMAAHSTSPSPSGPPDFAASTIASVEMNCRPQFCAMGEVCLESGTCVAPSSDCAPACMSDQACVAGACQAALPDPFVEDVLPATGLHNALVATSTGLALVFYDRTSGNIYGTSHDGAAWAPPFLIDGYGRMEPTTGDSGIGASLFVDSAGTWHVSYVDGAEETLRYASVTAGTVGPRVVVDDGSTDGTMPHADGRHVIGDDSSIVVTETGEIRIVYQDSSAHRAMLARRPVGGGPWTISVLDGMDHTGFWTEQVLVGGTSYVATWWRNEMGDDPTNGVRVLTVE